MEITWKSTGPILVFIAITASAIPFLLYFRHLSIEYVLLIVMLGTLGFCWGYYRRYASSSPAESGTADNQGYPGETGQPVNDPSIPVPESLRLPQQDQESAPDPAEGTKAPPKDLIGRLLLAFIILFVLLSYIVVHIWKIDSLTLIILSAIFLVVVTVFGSMIVGRKSGREGKPVPDIRDLAPAKLARPFLRFMVLALFASIFLLIFTVVETVGQSTMFQTVTVLSGLFIATGVVYGICCAWNPVSNYHRYTTIGAIVEFLIHFMRYVVAALILNGAIVVVLQLVSDKTVIVDLTGKYGFFLFLLFAFGNFLILSFAILKFSKLYGLGKEPAREDPEQENQQDEEAEEVSFHKSDLQLP